MVLYCIDSRSLPFLLLLKTNYLIPDIKDTFNLLDRDHDGKLDKKELETLLRYTGSLKSDSEMEELLSPVDTDRKFTDKGRSLDSL